jgi:hypothetical protein
MPRPMTPKHKPEMIIVRVRQFGGDAQGATLALERFTIHGVRLVSQMRRADEHDAVAAVIAALPTAWRCAIISVGWSDRDVYVELSRCDLEGAKGIGAALAQALPGCEIVMNGLCFAEIDSTIGFGGYPWSPPPSARWRAMWGLD